MGNLYELYQSRTLIDRSKLEGGVKRVVNPEGSPQLNTPQSQHVYELGVGCFFNARHYVSNGEKGAVHAHSWRIEVNFRGSVVNEQGMLVGFAEVKQLAQKQVNRFNGTILNEVEPFTHTPPTTENVAAVIYQEIKQIMDLPTLQLVSVCVWESPTSYVLYRERT